MMGCFWPALAGGFRPKADACLAGKRVNKHWSVWVVLLYRRDRILNVLNCGKPVSEDSDSVTASTKIADFRIR